ncbi:MAG TPA: carboxypeptidase regulatory-like domain-containing protein [Acidobacteriaceae bacterium]|jgi:plastocyanin|nr:carboxypeptidase regulatory-like domain-containing protein [Acidobacteriaceae bacterium]
MKSKRKIVAAAACVLMAAVAGCKKQASTGETVPKPNFTTIDWANAGTIEGTVHYVKTPPRPILIDMSQDPACGLGPANDSEQYVVNHGGFANVFIYVKDGLGNKVYAASSQPVDIDQKNCRYVPHVVGVMVGQPVRFINSDPTMHNVHIQPTTPGNHTVDLSQAPAGSANQPQDETTFNAPELMISVRCNMHPWMQGYINAASNPFFAVSDASGRYVIKGLPPGTYTVVTDQEQLGQKIATVTVAAKQTASQDFTYGDGPGSTQP